MLKTVRVPHELIALSQMQRAAVREVGAPLYLPAFEHQILEADARRDEPTDDLDWGAEAGGLTIGADEDDDFY
ncbi:hypothetical protein PRN20_05785 [Devosia sp. ZB163]|uniref:hypothetical protein n=1 Tax=Devosia sp. ZB163 TaxID=3025938 RepID=UPI0023612E15|nr:hypothetical protein [Devosia sp. ZB163]MDC9823237.1 hypothetical protein [Devosia sp. ZB163]